MNNINIIPIKLYPNAQKCKAIVLKENKKKSGIYRLNNLIDGSSYVGSSLDLTKRFYCYYSHGYLRKELLRSKSKINSAILKYNYTNFSIDILEYCNPSLLTLREQYYIDTLKPEYNIKKKASSRSGRKYSTETLLKHKNPKLTTKTLANYKKSKEM